MNSGFKALGAIIIFLTLAPSCLAGDPADDRWLGGDKFKHFGFSAFLSGGSYIVANRHFDLDKNKSFTVGVGITVSLGAAKEVIDYKTPDQTSSHKDLIWDIAGALTGALTGALLAGLAF